MTQEDKQLLLIDLCARLPYNIIVKPQNDKMGRLISVEVTDERLVYVDRGPNSADEYDLNEEIVLPYLRPMSSMTEEEQKEFKNSCKIIGFYKDGEFACTPDGYDWLNEHHFDYRGLIERGLAIEVTEENNPYE